MAIFNLFPGALFCTTEIGINKTHYACFNQQYVWPNGTYCTTEHKSLIIAPPNSGNLFSNSFFHASKASALDIVSDWWKAISWDSIWDSIITYSDDEKRGIFTKDSSVKKAGAITVSSDSTDVASQAPISTYDDSAARNAVNAGFSTDRLILEGDAKALANFGAGSYLELVFFYSSGAIAETLKVENLESYKYASGAIMLGARLLQSGDLYGAAGRMAGYGVGFALREELLEPLFGQPLPSNLNTSNIGGALKAAHVYNSVDVFVIGVNANLLNVMAPEMIFAISLVKNLVDPFLFNIIYDYTGIADENAMLSNTVLATAGVALQSVASYRSATNHYSFGETANIVVKKNIITALVNEAAVLTAEFVIKPTFMDVDYEELASSFGYAAVSFMLDQAMEFGPLISVGAHHGYYDAVDFMFDKAIEFGPLISVGAHNGYYHAVNFMYDQAKKFGALISVGAHHGYYDAGRVVAQNNLELAKMNLVYVLGKHFVLTPGLLTFGLTGQIVKDFVADPLLECASDSTSAISNLFDSALEYFMGESSSENVE